jgi:heptosyltransferase-3
VIPADGVRIKNLCGRLSLCELAAVIRDAAGFIGVESGPAHFANAFRRPAVFLMGSYRQFDRYLPYTGFLREQADEMLLRWAGPAAAIPVETVLVRAAAVFPDVVKLTGSQIKSAPGA